MVNQRFAKWNGSKKGSIANNDHLFLALVSATFSFLSTSYPSCVVR